MRPVDVYGLARTSGCVSGALPVARMRRLAPALADATGEVRYEFKGCRDARNRPAAQLDIEARLRLVCDRCGEPLDATVDETARFYFVPDAQTLETVPIEDIDEEPLIGSERFDLAALIEDQLILALPMTPRHARCELGAPSDAADPDDDDSRPNPFAVLGALKSRSG